MTVSKQELKPVKLTVLTAKQAMSSELKAKLTAMMAKAHGYTIEISLVRQQENIETTARALISSQPDLILLDSKLTLPSWPLIQTCANSLPRTRFYLDGSIDDILKLEIEQQNFSGVVGILKNDHLLFTAASREANIISKQSNMPQTRFNIGSVTKMMTAVAVLKMAGDLKLNLHQPISKLLEEKRIDYPHQALFNNFTLLSF